ncbi:hypothetical protein MHBO_004515, partial [Bonamia ostreae]
FIARILNLNDLDENSNFLFETVLKFVYIGILECANGHLDKKTETIFLKNLHSRFEPKLKLPQNPISNFLSKTKNDYTSLEDSSKPKFQSGNNVYSVIESICRMNKKKSNRMAKWILFHAAKLSVEIENIVLEYYNDLCELDVNKEKDENEKSEERIARVKKAKELATAFVKAKTKKFCEKNDLVFQEEKNGKKDEKICIFCRSKNEENEETELVYLSY